jgi:hypothetical protein
MMSNEHLVAAVKNAKSREQYMVMAVQNALEVLYREQNKLDAPTTPATPKVRYRQYYWQYPNIRWPNNGTAQYGCDRNFQFVLNGVAANYNTDAVRASVAKLLVAACDRVPRKIVSLINKIHASAKWCEKRTEGRLRAAEEIVKQQKKASELIEAMAVMKALGQ